MKKLFTATAFCGAVLAFSACGPKPDLETAEAVLGGPKQVLNVETGLSIDKAYIKPPLPGRDISAIYFTLSGGAEADRLTGVQTSLSSMAEIHTHIKEGDVMKMRRVEGVDVPAKELIKFQPGGYHIMVFGTELSPVATDAEMTLSFEKAGDVVLTVGILGRRDFAAVISNE